MSKLTIGMPVFNDRNFLEIAIRSLLDQTFQDFTLILSDDCSVDGSEEICKKIESEDSRVKYFRQKKNIGISKNMKFLLDKADSEYFMWAADDDIWDKCFIEKLIKEFENNKNLVSVFCSFQLIDEKGNPISAVLNFDYSGKNSNERLTKFILHPNDSFGYGIFKRQQIKNVTFPIWWWPNEKTAYNNIYPSLCFYLCQGEFVNVAGEPLFLNRCKTPSNINHRIPYAENSFNDFLAYSTRRFNLITVSTTLIRKSQGKLFALKKYPMFFLRWFLIPSYLALRHYIKLKLKNKFKI